VVAVFLAVLLVALLPGAARAVPVVPVITTTASPTTTVGLEISDTANLSGAVNPTGTITYQLFDASCSGPARFVSTVAVAGNGAYTSARLTTTAAGTYTFVAAYSGDANNAPVTSACGESGESVVVSKFSPTLSTTASGPVTVGQAIHDTASLTGFNPTATITFTLSGPTDSSCGLAPVFTATVPVNAGSGKYVSPNFVPTAPGTYRWQASYAGDANNQPVPLTSCSDPNESVVVSTAPTPVIAVTKSATPATLVEPGGNFTFTVTVSNPSTVDPIKITSLVDNIYGDTATRAGSTCGALIGTTLAPGATSPPCTFTGPFTGVSGASQTDTVTVTGVDTLGKMATATAHATVSLTTAAPQIAVTKAAAPTSRTEPGGNFTFTVTVSNPSTLEPVKITSLVDNIYGNLATRAGSTCGALIGVTLAPGATSAPCMFTGPFTGNAGDSQTDTVTVTGTNGGMTATATAQAP
jgi:hypothetical protein